LGQVEFGNGLVVGGEPGPVLYVSLELKQLIITQNGPVWTIIAIAFTALISQRS
jgi:hypothetical protein